MRQSLLRHAGQTDDAAGGLFPHSDVMGPEPAWRLLTFEEIQRELTLMNEMMAAGEFRGRKATLKTGKPKTGESKSGEQNAGEQTEWWPAGWVPIAGNGGGDLACLDLSPGGAGRVVQFGHASAKRVVFAPSFAAWLATLADGLEAGRYQFDPDDGLVEADED